MKRNIIQLSKLSLFSLFCILLFANPAYAHDPEGLGRLALMVMSVFVFCTLLVFIAGFQLYKKKKRRQTHFIRSVIIAAVGVFIPTLFIELGGITYIRMQYEILKGKKTGIIDMSNIGYFRDYWKVLNLKSFATITNLKSLDLGRTLTRDEELKHLSNLKSLEILRIDSWNITDEGVKYLVPLKNLKELKLGALGESKISDQGVKYLSNLKSLQELHIRGHTLTDEGIKYLVSLENLRGLALGWGNNVPRITDEGLKHLSTIKSLESLSLDSREITDNGIEHLLSLENLKELSLISGSKISDQGLRHLSKLKSLEYLEIGYDITITDEVISYLASLKNLKGLKFRLKKSHIRNGGLQHLSKLKSLEYLDLGTVESVTSEGVGYLISLDNLKSLRLNVPIDVQKSSVVHLSQMKSLRKLSMYMYPDENQRILEYSLPNCKFDWYYGDIHWKDIITIDK